VLDIANWTPYYNINKMSYGKHTVEGELVAGIQMEREEMPWL